MLCRQLSQGWPSQIIKQKATVFRLPNLVDFGDLGNEIVPHYSFLVIIDIDGQKSLLHN